VNVAVEGLRAGYGSAVIVDGVSFEVPDHGALAVVGRNGMGKSTLLKAITGYLRPMGGAVVVGGRTTTGLATFKLARMGVAYTPQEQSLFGELSVAENLSIGTSSRSATDLRDEILSHFPVLRERLRQRAGTLSGGEQKMLTLAKALTMQPQLLLLDEISDGLGPAVVTAVGDVLAALRERFGCTILMVEQNLDLSLRVADRIAVLKLGRIVFERDAGEAGLRDTLLEQLAPSA
jgi:branched-chain amino acid transport system ATP-binding protein